MGNIHKRAQRDLDIIWGTSRFGDLATFISPSGNIQENVSCNITYSQTETDENGFRIVVYKPKIEVKISLLNEVPSAGEKWIIRIPKDKNSTTLYDFSLIKRPIRDETFGIITLLIGEAEQSA